MVSAEPGISLFELFRGAPEGISRDDLYALIATRELYVDLQGTRRWRSLNGYTSSRIAKRR